LPLLCSMCSLVCSSPRAPASPQPRLGTATADVPAKEGDRVTVVCAPAQGQRSALGQRRLLGSAPHGTKPGGLACLACLLVSSQQMQPAAQVL
jgi:hypothetical protein